MGKITSWEWRAARKKVFNEFWDDKIDFETFKTKIEEVDEKFRR